MPDAIDAGEAAGVVPVAVVATAGTTLTGAVDPWTGPRRRLRGARRLAARRRGLRHCRRLDALRGHLFAGVERGLGHRIGAHKWLYLPKACGVVLVRRHEDLRSALSHEEDYIPHERPDHHMVDITLEYSRPFRALKLWLAFRAHGAAAIRAAIERNLGQARLLHAEISRYDDLEVLCAEPPLSIVPFRHPGRRRGPGRAQREARGGAAAERRRLGRARARRQWCACGLVVNCRTTDDDVRALVELAREVGAALV